MLPTVMVIGGILVVICGIAGAIKIHKHFEEKRRAAMHAFAEEIGLDFSATENSELRDRLQAFDVFNRGHGKRMQNVILGETEIAKIAMFDYRYTTGSGKNQTTHSHTIVSMESDALDVPSFTMRPENFFDSVGAMLGFQDIDFDHHPQFSKMYVLKGEQEDAIRKFFDQELLDFFTDKNGVYFEAHRGAFIYYAGWRKPDQLRESLNNGYSVYSAFTDRLTRS